MGPYSTTEEGNVDPHAHGMNSIPRSSPSPAQRYQPAVDNNTASTTNDSRNLRSVTPAMNNTRGASYAARATSPAKHSAAASTTNHNASVRSSTPNRYYGAYNRVEEEETGEEAPSAQPQPRTKDPPASTGLLRLTLRKPMGIVFEPMYDPNNPNVQRGVRICDLPRTGAAALSRKLEVGDELLSINDKTMSRLTFDEIMDFIIEADPDKVNLLFRRPRRDTVANNTTRPNAVSATPNGVKWVDDGEGGKTHTKKKKQDKKSPKRSKHKDEDDTIQSEIDDTSTIGESVSLKRSRRRHHKDPYESESFLDLLIDSLCANPDGVCRERGDRRRPDDDFSDDDMTFNSEADSTYVTYDSEPTRHKERSSRRKGQRRDDVSSADEETDNETALEEARNHKAQRRDDTKTNGARDLPHSQDEPEVANKPYEDDGTLETAETLERLKEVGHRNAVSPPPLGLAPVPEVQQEPPPAPQQQAEAAEADDGANPAPIAELEYDEFDHGAEVSVMDSLGGPSLIIEKQRQAAAIKGEEAIPADIVENFGLDFAPDAGLTREQTAQRHPMKFYTHVVKALLQENEPEKVRLLDKLLAKYKGREDHLVQKLNVRYNKEESATPTIPEEDGGQFNFTNAVNKTKESPATAAVVQTAKDRMVDTDPFKDSTGWPDNNKDNNNKALQQPQGNEKNHDDESQVSESVSGSEYSGDSIDGTSPAVIAQVSELLNYVYGKTSVPGQIDRVSTIMRAYEGREAVLLELLETKALIKANGEKENAANLPSFLRNSPQLQKDDEENPAANGIPNGVSQFSSPNVVNHPNPSVGGGPLINDDVSSMSGVSSPAEENGGKEVEYNPAQTASQQVVHNKLPTAPSEKSTFSKSDNVKASNGKEKKKKKGMFGGIFGRKRGKDPSGNKNSNTPRSSRKVKQQHAPSPEGSI